jgi:site-specific DNA-cytosine methylase
MSFKILVACEFSGVVRDAFRKQGHDAWSCDLLASESENTHHIIGDVRNYLDDRWDMLIAHPPCTYLSRAGARWWKDVNRQKLADEAAEFVFALRDAPIKRIAIENPIGQLNRRWRYPDQTIQPWQFGHEWSKATCLWLKNLPKLMPTKIVEEYKPLIRSNVTARARRGEKQHGKFSGGLITAKTFSGIAEAMASQWGKLK